jgi:hypothetical protein
MIQSQIWAWNCLAQLSRIIPSTRAIVKESYVQCYIDYQNCYNLIDVELMKEVSNFGAADAIKLVDAIDDLLELERQQIEL